MQKWLRISLLLCTFGFFREMRPSESFVTDFLTGDWLNITTEQVNKEIYPIGTYSYLAQLILVFLVTDMLRYKPIIVLSSFAGIVLFVLLTWSKEMWQLQIAQISYGTFMASEVAYYTYIYAKVDKDRYQIVTGHTRSAILCGKFLGGVLGQVLVSTNSMDYQELHYISIGSQIISLVIAFALPSVHNSVYFHKNDKSDAKTPVDLNITTISQKLEPENVENKDGQQNKSTLTLTTTAASSEDSFSWHNAIHLLLDHTVNAYSKPIVVQWSVWWALATCGQLLVYSFIQILWKEINPDNISSNMNGAADATLTLLGAAGALAAGFMNSSRHKNWHIWILTICSLSMGAFVITSAMTHLLWLAYMMYILFGTFYYFVITIATATVAENLDDDSFGLIFGINTLVALILQTIITLIVVTDNIGLGLNVRGQYMVFGSYFVILALLYFTFYTIRFICTKTSCFKQQKTLIIQQKH